MATGPTYHPHATGQGLFVLGFYTSQEVPPIRQGSHLPDIGALLFESVHLDLIPVVDDTEFCITQCVQLRFESGGIFVSRASLEASGPRVVASCRDDRVFTPNVRWVHDPGRATPQFSLIVTSTLVPDTEIYRVASWFDEVPTTMTPSQRDGILERYFREIRGGTNTSLQRHVWLLAGEMIRWHRRLQGAWGGAIPAPADLLSLANFTTWKAITGGQGKTRPSEVISADTTVLAFQKRRQAKETAKRQRQAARRGEVPTIIERGWAALSAIATHLQ